MSITQNPNRINGQRLEFGNPVHIAYVRKLEKEAEAKEKQCQSCRGHGSVECSHCDGAGEVDCEDCEGTGENQ